VRVVAGRFGGRRLRAPRGTTVTRPTSDRVREAVFAMLDTVRDERVLDLFAGTGALGIEALSRGARRAVFVERDGRALAALSANLESLGLDESEAELRRGEALGALRSARASEETYDLVLIDPPYRRAGELGGELSLALEPLLQPLARVVVESDRRAPLELPWEIEKERRYGDTTITIHRYR
jgi:16S rRNA (guanine966-N2)-methyltransferase